ncbi:MAG TPA: hypothetical protein VF908_08355 [Gemmatimonadaceae bacterium]
MSRSRKALPQRRFADATSRGEAGVRRIQMEYVFVKEPEGWKISTIRDGGRDYAP